MVSQHALRRTSPKGTPFRGVCVRCGKTDLKPSDLFNDECEGIAMSENDALAHLVRGGDQ